MEKKRLNIGLFVGDIADDFSKGICKGAMQAAEEFDANLIIFPGKYFDRDLQLFDGIQYEYQHNTLFTYVFPEKIDLLIVAIGSIGYLSTAERRKAFLDYFSFVPVITIAARIEGYEYILYDNEAGVREAVEYLIAQGKKNICCLAGCPTHCEAGERLETYRRILQEHGLKQTEDMIEYCNMSRISREQAESLLEHNPDVDAIVCVNDEVAYCLYEVLEERKIAIGEDICVVGFDDLAYASQLNPPMATVRADAVQLGYCALAEGIASVRNHTPLKHRVPVRFIPRESAGRMEKSSKEQWENSREALVNISVDTMLRDNHAVNMISRDMFNFDKFVDQNYALLLENLYMLDIKNCYLYLLPSPKIHLNEERWVPPKDIYLKACSCDGRVMAIPRHAQKYPLEELYSHEYMPNRRYTMILLDLFTTDTQHGLLLLEMDFDKHYYFEALTYQMSAAVRMLSLMHMQEDTQKQLEDSLQQLKLHNIQLGNVAQMDELTKTLNRRGFEKQADAMLRNQENIGKYIFAVYADMDNLKIVNDRFGHKEGDFALKSIAEMLHNIFEENAAIGRIGGDEFAILALREEPVDMRTFRLKVKECVDAFNEACEKPYYIKMTVGGYTQNFMMGCKLSNLLENADDDLYEAKKLRTKEIMKPGR